MNFEAKRAEIEKREREIDARLIELADQRRTHALGATDGNKKALAAIAELDQKIAALKREVETLIAAREQIAALQREAQVEIAARAREREIVEARKLAGDVTKLNAEIDADMISLRLLFERRSGLLRELANTKTIAANLILRWQQRFGATAAARASGLDRYLSLEHVPPAHVTSLSESNSGLSRPIVAVEREPPTPRYRGENNDAYAQRV